MASTHLLLDDLLQPLQHRAVVPRVCAAKPGRQLTSQHLPDSVKECSSPVKARVERFLQRGVSSVPLLTRATGAVRAKQCIPKRPVLGFCLPSV